jgi:hypothetical protein
MVSFEHKGQQLYMSESYCNCLLSSLNKGWTYNLVDGRRSDLCNSTDAIVMTYAPTVALFLIQDE